LTLIVKKNRRESIRGIIVSNLNTSRFDDQSRKMHDRQNGKHMSIWTNSYAQDIWNWLDSHPLFSSKAYSCTMEYAITRLAVFTM